jgi:NAD(P)-dependent dehydrogenase (short-subunit alcohol dehydrogenase family)
MANGLMELSGGVEQLAKNNPSKRLGRGEDIAGTVVFLASRAASHINGAVLTIDGGEVWARGSMVDMGKEAEKPKL